MTKRKKPDSPSEGGKKAKAELTEQQLKEISGGPIYMDRLYSTQVQTTDTANLSPTSLNVVKP